MSNQQPRFHAPDELLATARKLLATGDPSLARAVVLEAITALEALIHQTVFSLLPSKIPMELVKWLEDRTRMDFDTRLGILTPFATGQSIDKDKSLWERYKRAKKIRNEVTHQGRVVSINEASDVLQTVEAWIQFIGQTAELDLSLELLKKHLEEHHAVIHSEREAIALMIEFYRRARGVKINAEARLDNDRSVDVLLSFGGDRVAIQAKSVRSGISWLKNRHNRLHEAESLLVEATGVTRVAIVWLFAGTPVPEELQFPQVREHGRLRMIGVGLDSFVGKR